MASAGGGRWNDFDGDGIRDIAAGEWAATVAGKERAGAVWVGYGSGAPGLRLTEDASGVPTAPQVSEMFGNNEADDFFGGAPASTTTRLIVGSDGEKVATDAGAGSMAIFGHAFKDGIPAPLSVVTRDSSWLNASAEKGDAFGASVSATLYRPAGVDKTGTLVAVGSPGEDLRSNTAKDAGFVHTFFISAEGKTSNLREYSQDVSGVADSSQSGDQFGFSVQLANFGEAFAAGPESAMLAVGVWGELGSHYGQGATQVFRFDTAGVGAGSAWVVSGTFGLPEDALAGPACVGVSRKHLLVGFPINDTMYGVTWAALRGDDGGEVHRWTPEPGVGRSSCSQVL
ncbi:hypothetical protein AB0I28_06825 [Phytomonospora sp. NPDC050363]|uniref:hypothetical protein n=1 Tax=Phytomonospora sp. NPDC050363 TaxID=3155642 RepID=UPI0033DE79C2